MDDQRNKLFILCEEDIENHKEFKKSYTNENNGLTIIDTSSEESIQYQEKKYKTPRLPKEKQNKCC